jgi:CRISPR system Cascade subunit CasC
MKLELHILQNFAPSNLNRDDTGSPKDCELGGVRRARISSQCLKRAIRQTFEHADLLPEAERAARTKRLIERVAEQPAMTAATSDPARARRAVTNALMAVGLKADEKNDKTQYLLFVPRAAIGKLATLVAENLEVLAPADAEPAKSDADEPSTKKEKAKSKKADKAQGKESADPKIVKAVTEILEDGSRTPELALFGRMIADAPGWNVEAACQVAHGISTNRLAMDFDFYTAVDDYQQEDTTGADMMGTIPFNSSCFYRYLVVDVDALVANLGADDAAKEQAKRTVSAFVRAAVLAIPTGKQNSMAAQNLPSVVLADLRDGAEPRSLTNAFVRPVAPGRDGDLVEQSAKRLAAYAASLDAVYGERGRKDLSFIALDPSDSVGQSFAGALPQAKRRASLDELTGQLVAAAFGGAP